MQPSSRETFITVMMLTVAVAAFFVVVVAFMGVYVIHAMIIFLLMTGFGFFHWLTWGRAMSQEAAAEREEEEALAEPDDRITDGPHGPPRY